MPFFKKTAHNRCSVALCAVLVPILTFSLGANLVTLVEERLRRLEYLEWKYNEGKMDVPMRIAYGYAIFDEQYDRNMEETRNRADVKMYEKKRAIKTETVG